MADDLPGLLGWWLPGGAKKWHASNTARRSLCGKYTSIGVVNFETISADATPTTPDDCRSCAVKVEKQWFALDDEEAPRG